MLTPASLSASFLRASALPLSLAILLLSSSCARTAETDTAGTATATSTTTTTPTDMSTIPSVRSARDILTPAEVSGIIGKSVALQAGSDSTTATATTVTSFVPSNDPNGAPIVNIKLASEGMYADARDMARNGGHKTMDMPSIGQNAYYDDADRSLYVRDKGQTLIITVNGQVEGKTSEKVASQLGRIATGRLTQM
jgi:hypothetical protein